MTFLKNSYWHIVCIAAYIFSSQKVLAQTNSFLETEAISRFWGGGLFLLFCLMGTSIFLLYKKQRKLLQEQSKYKMVAINQATLAYQMDQHFAFNTLNSIQRLILEKQTLIAMQYIAQFGKLIRSTLHQAKNNYLTIEEEISNLELYLQMELLRTKERFTYGIEVGQEVDSYNIEVPTGLIQPLVEQAIWQGLIPAEGKGLIRIAFHIRSGYVHCEIEDDGIIHTPLIPRQKKHIASSISRGILLLEERIKTLNLGSKASIELESRNSTETEAQKNLIRLKIPILRYQ